MGSAPATRRVAMDESSDDSDGEDREVDDDPEPELVLDFEDDIALEAGPQGVEEEEEDAEPEEFEEPGAVEFMQLWAAWEQEIRNLNMEAANFTVRAANYLGRHLDPRFHESPFKVRHSTFLSIIIRSVYTQSFSHFRQCGRLLSLAQFAWSFVSSTTCYRY